MTTAVPMSTLRRVARPAPALHEPARAYASGSTIDGPWNHELPGTGIEVILELEDGWELEIGGRRQAVRSFAAGLVAAPVRSRPRGSTQLVQLAIDPLAVPALFGVPAGALRGTSVDLGAILGGDAERLLHALSDIDDTDLRAAAADAWAVRRILRGEGPHAVEVPPDVARAVALLRASDGRLEIADLATELGCSRRHLARRFATWLGVSPSEYRRLVRFERTTGALRADPSQPLGRLAADHGYADHAHMDREFRALAGMPPSAVAQRAT